MKDECSPMSGCFGAREGAVAGVEPASPRQYAARSDVRSLLRITGALSVELHRSSLAFVITSSSFELITQRVTKRQPTLFVRLLMAARDCTLQSPMRSSSGSLKGAGERPLALLKMGFGQGRGVPSHVFLRSETLRPHFARQ